MLIALLVLLLLNMMFVQIWYLPDGMRAFQDPTEVEWIEDKNWSLRLDDGWDLKQVSPLLDCSCCAFFVCCVPFHRLTSCCSARSVCKAPSHDLAVLHIRGHAPLYVLYVCVVAEMWTCAFMSMFDCLCGCWWSGPVSSWGDA